MLDIDEIRRANIKTIETEVGSAATLAKLADMSVSQYVNLRDGAKDSKTGKPRGMRKGTARKFEIAGKKTPGWLDQDHSQSPAKNTPAIAADAAGTATAFQPRRRKEVEEILKILGAVSDVGLGMILSSARTAAKEFPAMVEPRKQRQ